MSFNKKTTIQQTGLGDEQYKGLQQGQKGLGEQLQEGFTGAEDRFDTVDRSLSGLSTGLRTDLSNAGAAINTATNAGFTSLNDYLSDQFKASQNNQSQLATNQMTGFTDLNALNQDRFNNLQADVSGVQTSVDTGFSDTATANQNIQTAVDTGFSDQSQGFADVQGAMTENTRDIRGDITDNFNTTNQSLSDAQTSIQGDIAASQREVLGGQGGLASDLSDLSSNNDTYFGALSENQANMQSGQDTFRTTFDDYVDRYSDDTTLANQTRADLQQAQATGFDVTRQRIGTLGNTVAQGQQDIQQGTEQLADTVQGGFRQTEQTSQNLRDTLSNEIADTGAGLMANQENLVTGQQALAQTFMNESGEIDTALINQTRDLAAIASTQTDLDMDMRQNFQQLSTAFDDQGQLIENSIDANGNSIMREMDANGNLMLRAMDAQGNDLGSKVINVNDSVRRLQGLTRRQGANMQMGQLSPASQMSSPMPASGFANPFTTTQ